MIFKIGTKQELSTHNLNISETVLDKIFSYVEILDDEYGYDRNYFESGGYVMVLETIEDVLSADNIIDFKDRVCELVEIVDDDYLSALYLLGDDYAIVVIMPLDIVPEYIFNQMKEDL